MAEQRVERLGTDAVHVAVGRHQFGDDGDALVGGRFHDQPGADQPTLVEPSGDLRQHRVRGDQLLEPQPAAFVGDRVGHHQDAHRTGLARDGGQAADPVQRGRGLAGDDLVVLGRDRPFLDPEDVGRAHLGVLDALAVDPAAGRLAVVDAGDVRHRAAQHPDGTAGHVPGRAAARPVAGDPELGALRGHVAVHPHRAVRLADLRREGERAVDGVDPHVPVAR